MSPHDENDSLSELLSGAALPPGDPARRESIFTQTRGVLRRRRLVRRCAWTAALAACYVVGALSVLAWQSAHPDQQLAGQPRGVIDKDAAPPVDEPRLLSSTVGSEAWNSRDLKSRPH